MNLKWIFKNLQFKITYFHSHRLKNLFRNRDPDADDDDIITEEILHRNIVDAIDLHNRAYR